MKKDHKITLNILLQWPLPYTSDKGDRKSGFATVIASKIFHYALANYARKYIHMQKEKI